MKKHKFTLVALMAAFLCSCAPGASEAKAKEDDGLISAQTKPVEGKTIEEVLIDAYYEFHRASFEQEGIEKSALAIKDYYGCYNGVFVVSFNLNPTSGLAVEYSSYFEDVHYRFGSLLIAPRLFFKGYMYTFDKIGNFGLSMKDHRRLESSIRGGVGVPVPGLGEIYDADKAYGIHETDEEPDLKGYKVGGAIVRGYFAKRESEYRAMGIGPEGLRISEFFGAYNGYYCFRFNCLPFPLSEEDGIYVETGKVDFGFLSEVEAPWFWKAGKFYYWHEFNLPYAEKGVSEGDMAKIKDAMDGKITVSTDPLREVY